MRILFLGSGEFAKPTLYWLSQSGHQVPIVVTQPARGSGRGRRLTRTPVHALAQELGYAVLAVEDINAPDIVQQLRSLDAQLGLVIAFGQKIGNELLSALPGGFINLHASLLPKFRGAAPINWAMVKGESQTGCTVFRIVERMDAGPVLWQDATPIGDTETAGELHDRLAVLGVRTVQSALGQFSGGQVPAGREQDHAARTIAPKLQKSDGQVRFDQPAVAVVRHIHGMTPWPGAAARFEAADGRWEDVLLVRACAPSGPRLNEEQASGREPGVLDKSLRVATIDGPVRILEVKPTSGRLMTWTDYVNGRRVTPGDRFVNQGAPQESAS